jgi:hypothetical protein
MRLDRLIIVDGEILSSLSLDDEGNNTIVVVEHCFIWQCSALNYAFAIQMKVTLSTIAAITAIFLFSLFPLREKAW